MAVIEGGTSGALQGVGNQSGSPAHVTIKPVPVGLLGTYRLATVTGTMSAALAASAQFFYMRWTDATRLCVIHSVQVDFQALTLFTANTLVDFGFDLIKATAVSAGGGSTAIPGSSCSKMMPTMGASLFGATDIRRSDTGALTPITTVDAFPIAMSIGDPQRVNPAAATEEQRVNDPTLRYQPNVLAGEHPLVLGQNEGLVLRNRVVWPAAGTGVFKIEVAWSEVTAY
jgi:hypothetical protein